MKRLAMLVIVNGDTVDAELVHRMHDSPDAAAELRAILANSITASDCVLRDVLAGEFNDVFTDDLKTRYPDVTDAQIRDQGDEILIRHIAQQILGRLPIQTPGDGGKH